LRAREGSLAFTRDALHIDPAAETARIAATLRDQVLGTFRKKGAVVGMSGGIDSSVVASLATAAFGKERVLGLLMPERDSSDDALRLGRLLGEQLGIPMVVENLEPTLLAMGCYERQVDAIRRIFPDYGPGHRHKITLPSILEGDRLNVYQLTVESPSGERRTTRMPLGPYLQVVAATNFKQRLRATLEYYHADRLNYAVLGTPNRLEYDQGFFVKGGDGLADAKPIAHLYKSQVYALAAHLGVPAEIRKRPPTTDTYSLPQGQDEFYFSLPYDQMDLCLYAHDHGVSPADVGALLGLAGEQVERVYRDIEAKRRFARYLHSPPLLVEPVGH
jgi:NAD+ synthase